MSLDITDTIEPRSDQQNYEDYLTGPRTVTIARVTRGSAEQPVVIHLEEFPQRPYKPSKSMRRVLVSCWGPDAASYVGRRMELYGDPKVMYGGEEVGGIKIRALSHLEGPKKMPLTVRRGKRASHIVQPLQLPAEPPVGVSDSEIESADVDGLRAVWSQASPVQQSRIRERVTELQAEDGDV